MKKMNKEVKMTKRTAIMRYSFRICRKEAFSSGKLKKNNKNTEIWN